MIIEEVRNIDLEKIHNIDASDNESFVRALKKIYEKLYQSVEFYNNREFQKAF